MRTYSSIRGWKGLCLLVLCWAALAVQAHVGVQNLVFEGLAGPYPLRVVVKPPGVVPGLAEITVRRLSDEVTSVSVLPMRWDAGRKGAPPPDVAKSVPGDPALFTAELWLMNSGAYSVLVQANGARGEHALMVPVNSVATQRLGLPGWFGAMLAGLGVLLVALLVSIAGAAVRESTLGRGQAPDAARRRRGLAASGVFVVLLGAALVFGRNWWRAEEQRYLNRVLYEPVPLEAAVKEGRLEVTFEAARLQRRDSTPLIPDHGKLMHLFLVRDGAFDAMAHLHPVKVEARGGRFTSQLPPLPGGAYRVFADITQESGFAQTLVGRVDLPEPAAAAAWTPSDPDDAFRSEPGGVDAADAETVALGGGLRLRRLGATDPVRVDEPATLRFQVLDAADRPVELDVYLGMFGHAFVLKPDGSVFSHLHPQGNVSMGAGLAFTRRELGEDAARKLLEEICSPLGADHVVAFPYAFPRAGEYRVWVQVKVRGRVETGAFRLAVGE